MTAEYVIREATLGDSDQIYEIWKQGLLQSLGTSEPPAGDHHGHFERLVREQDANFKIFVADGGAAGILGFQGLAPFRANPITRHLMAESSTYIRPDAMRANVGRDLAFHALRHADTSEIQFVVAYVAITNERTLIAAQRAGFQLVGYLPKNTKTSGGAPLAYLVYPAGSWSSGELPTQGSTEPDCRPDERRKRRAPRDLRFRRARANGGLLASAPPRLAGRRRAGTPGLSGNIDVPVESGVLA